MTLSPLHSHFENIAIVLVGVRVPGNIGAAARAMANMGLSRLVLADSPVSDLSEALKLARDGGDIVRSAESFTTLEEAIAPYGLVAGTTRRKGRSRRSLVEIAEAIPRIALAAAHNQVAILFGREDFGLSNEELGLCQFALSIPSARPFSSLNVAQAVMIVAYELHRFGGVSPPLPPSFVPRAELKLFYERLARLLERIGYQKAGDRDVPASVLEMLARVFGRSGLTPDELNGLHGFCRQIERAVTTRRGHRAEGIEPGAREKTSTNFH